MASPSLVHYVRRAATAAGTLLLSSCAAVEAPPAQSSSPDTLKLTENRFERVDEAMRAEIASGEIPGASVMLAQNGEVAYFSSAGYANLETQTPIAEDTIFRFYSMTKPITCAAVMTLWDDGLINLDEPITTYIPEFADMQVRTPDGLVPAERDITIRHLMTHTSGLSYPVLPTIVSEDYEAANVFAIRNRTAETLEAHVKRLAEMPLLAQPGTEWNYGESMGVLGRLVEVVSGKSFGTYLDQRIFSPLGMDDTGFYVPPEKADRLAELYHLDTARTLSNAENNPQYGGDYLEKPLLEYGGAGLLGTAGNYMSFAQMLLNQGEAGGQRVLSAEAVELMTSNQLDESFGDTPLASSGRGSGIGFGFCGLVTVAPPTQPPAGAVGEYGWSGWASTNFWIDPRNDIAGLIFTQVIPDDIGSVELTASVREAIYGDP
ncbi:serine hydrolase domain-containing protein [Henriciella marina]|uniref:Serine hydrolase n=1 Tax=Henriciella marina TaxID=453851 RepID=A0ABT4LQ28_9PROT|nr:serine hydrolase domain-containing protein [Henriciella marina]MCZ4296435.1 serine hydrolase [Henriciella marina]